MVLSLKPAQQSSQPETFGGLQEPAKEDGPSVLWSAREEIRLLDAIEQYGFGNWQDISKHIETKAPAG